MRRDSYIPLFLFHQWESWGLEGEATWTVTHLPAGRASLWTQLSPMPIPCFFYEAMLLLEKRSANSSLESRGINHRPPIGPQTIILEAKGQNESSESLIFVSDIMLDLRIMSSSVFCKRKQSCHWLQICPPRTQLSDRHARVGMAGTALLRPGDVEGAGHFSGPLWQKRLALENAFIARVFQVCTTYSYSYRKVSSPLLIFVNICWSVGRVIQRMCLPLTFHPKVNN